MALFGAPVGVFKVAWGPFRVAYILIQSNVITPLQYGQGSQDPFQRNIDPFRAAWDTFSVTSTPLE